LECTCCQQVRATIPADMVDSVEVVCYSRDCSCDDGIILTKQQLITDATQGGTGFCSPMPREIPPKTSRHK
jgi:hypothetical protein